MMELEPTDWNPRIEDPRVPSVPEAVDMLIAAIERDRAAGRHVSMPFTVDALRSIAVSDTARSLKGS